MVRPRSPRRPDARARPCGRVHRRLSRRVAAADTTAPRPGSAAPRVRSRHSRCRRPRTPRAGERSRRYRTPVATTMAPRRDRHRRRRAGRRSRLRAVVPTHRRGHGESRAELSAWISPRGRGPRPRCRWESPCSSRSATTCRPDRRSPPRRPPARLAPPPRRRPPAARPAGPAPTTPRRSPRPPDGEVEPEMPGEAARRRVAQDRALAEHHRRRIARNPAAPAPRGCRAQCARKGMRFCVAKASIRRTAASASAPIRVRPAWPLSISRRRCGEDGDDDVAHLRDVRRAPRASRRAAPGSR